MQYCRLLLFSYDVLHCLNFPLAPATLPMCMFTLTLIYDGFNKICQTYFIVICFIASALINTVAENEFLMLTSLYYNLGDVAIVFS